MLSSLIAWLLQILKTILIFSIGYGLFLFAFQRKLMYFPSGYSEQALQVLAQKEEISYQIGHHKQIAYYVPARSSTAPDCLWVILGGNASVALGWSGLVAQYPDPNSAFLLIDYPGYGQNEGRPSLKHNMQAVELAYLSLLEHLSITPDAQLPFRLGVLSHSLGSAMAVHLAKQFPVKMLLLLSPFTSMNEVVRIHFPIFGRLLGNWLKDQYQVESELISLQSLPAPPRMAIIHGDDDEIVPVNMSRRMAENHPDFIEYHEITNADHNFIYDHLPQIMKQMQKMCDQ